MFGFLDDVIDAALDTTLSVATLGMYGEFSKDNVATLINAGVSIYTIAEMFDVSEDIIKEMIDT